jgi:spectinomycin phosphotransferase
MAAMRTEPEGLSETLLESSLYQDWGLRLKELAYTPVGFGSYHWKATDVSGGRWFVTADDLQAMGSQDSPDAEVNFAGLRAAYETAAALRDGGLEFVVAPVPTLSGEVLARLNSGWAASIFPYLDGEPAGDGSWLRGSLVTTAGGLIGRLHSAHAPSALRPWDAAVPYRKALWQSIGSLETPWDTGPYGERTHQLLVSSSSTLSQSFDRYDRLCATLGQAPGSWVITHGEPHSANFIRTATGSIMLIDWDTVRLAPPERDLWILLESCPDGLEAYQSSARGIRPNAAAMELFALRWMLADVCVYVRRFRGPHGDTVDDLASFSELELWLQERLPGMQP